MAYTITDRCVACGSCAEQCPVEAISEGDGKYEINPRYLRFLRFLRRSVPRRRYRGRLIFLRPELACANACAGRFFVV